MSGENSLRYRLRDLRSLFSKNHKVNLSEIELTQFTHGNIVEIHTIVLMVPVSGCWLNF